MPRRPNLPAFTMESIVSEEPQDACQSAAQCERMSTILEFLSLGSWRDIHDDEALLGGGVTHILNVAKEVDDVKPPDSCVVLQIPLIDDHRENIAEHLAAACEFIEAARLAKGRVLVHCRRGISRSPAIVVGYLMRHCSKSYEEAVDYVKDRRKCVSLNIAFREFLSSYTPGGTPGDPVPTQVHFTAEGAAAPGAPPAREE